MPVPPPVDAARLAALFPDAVPDNTDPQNFELGLVLGGTVSAGAYTAGALDFLLEALEAWYRDGTPRHRVVIKTAAGSSGGAVCTSILGLLSSRVVDHVAPDRPEPTGNPLWDLWVDEFQMDLLLSTSDITAMQDADAGTGATMTAVQHVPALLNCQMIDTAGAKLADMGVSPGEPLPYFTAPFRAAVTVANLRGIPYSILDIPTLGDYSGAAYVQHDDFAWFAFPNGASPAVTPSSLGKREDEFWLGQEGASGYVGYATLVAFATASGAMPVGLAARTLRRPVEHYHYRPIVRAVSDLPNGYRVDWPEPAWDALPDTQDGTYAFTAVDGGTFNNDPVSLVHRALAGLVGHNPRGKSDARRAIMMIDPLADQPKPIAPVGKSLLAVAESMIGAAVSAARYLTADMELFARDDVFSRFQLVPFRPEKNKVGEAALSGTSLFAAAGWCARDFRVHDFLLGRWNMCIYLQRELVLAGDNPLFAEWTPGQRQDWALDAEGKRMVIEATTPAGDYFLPILPVAPEAAANAPNAPAWPNGAYDPATLKAPLAGRLRALLDQLVKDNGGGGLLPWAVGLFAVPGVVDFVAAKVVAEFTTDLTAAGLWPAAPEA